MASVPSCPACDMPLGLFTPRESTAHVNACLDAQQNPPPALAAAPTSTPTCAVCARDLTSLTPAARAEHANRCADATLPLGQEPGRPRRPRSRPGRAAPPPPPASATGDESVRKLLDLLGLARYAPRFAAEEIDLAALRLLDDADFAQMRIPDAARRRIAEAMHSVPILAQIQGEAAGAALGDGEGNVLSQEAIVPTQQFQTSKLGEKMRRREPLFGNESSDGDDEFPCAPAQQAAEEGEPQGVGKVNDAVSKGMRTASPVSDVRNETDLKRGADGYNSMSSRDVLEALTVTGGASPPPDYDGDEDESSVSSLRDIERGITACSQISLHSKLERWRQKQVRREKARHKREMDRIQSNYEQMQKRICTGRNASDKTQPLRETNVNDVSSAQDAIDLTQNVTDDDEIQKVHTPTAQQRHFPKSRVNETIVISSGRPPRKAHDRIFGSDDDSLAAPLLNESPRYKRAVFKTVDDRPPFFSSSEEDVHKGTEEEVMDLIGSEKENVETQENEITQQTNNESAFVGGTANGEDCDQFSQLEGEKTQTAGKKPPSRLKKPRKVGPGDVLAAIRLDRGLYDDILMMESVPFARILESVRGSGVNVSKKALTDLLQAEGVAFKAEQPKSGSRATQYFVRLNCEL